MPLLSLFLLLAPCGRAAGTLKPGEANVAAFRTMEARPSAAWDSGPASDYQPVLDLEPRGFAEAVQGFNEHIDLQRPLVKNADNLPFILSHGHKTARSILMVHGLTDSPYYMRILAQTFFDRGYNVVAVLLPGHGTSPEDLLHVRLWQWREMVAYGMGVAEQLGDEISLAGFSTGGALVLDALDKNFTERDEPRRLGGLYLFSPAIEIANPDAFAACIPGATLLKPWVQADPDRIVEDNPYRYKKMSTNSVCQLFKLTAENAILRDQTLTFIGGHGIPVFAVQSEADTTVRPDAVRAFVQDVGPSGELVFYPRELNIAHADVTRPEAHPEAYRGMEARLNAFLAKRESAPPAPRRIFEEPSRSEALDELRSLDKDRP